MKKRNKKEVMLVVATVIAAILIGSGCTHTWNYPPLKMDDQYRDIAYKYYVIDAYADVPDAFFETYEEASRLLGEYRMAFGPDWRLSITDPEDQKSWNQKNIDSDGSWK